MVERPLTQGTRWQMPASQGVARSCVQIWPHLKRDAIGLASEGGVLELLSTPMNIFSLKSYLRKYVLLALPLNEQSYSVLHLPLPSPPCYSPSPPPPPRVSHACVAVWDGGVDYPNAHRPHLQQLQPHPSSPRPYTRAPHLPLMHTYTYITRKHICFDTCCMADTSAAPMPSQEGRMRRF